MNLLHKFLLEDALQNVQSSRIPQPDLILLSKLLYFPLLAPSDECKRIKASIGSFPIAIQRFLVLDSDDEYSKLVLKVLKMYEQVENFTETLWWLTESQMVDLNRLCLKPKDSNPNEYVMAILKYIEDAPESSLESALTNPEALMRNGCESNIRAYEILVGIHEQWLNEFESTFDQISLFFQNRRGSYGRPREHLTSLHKFDSRLGYLLTQSFRNRATNWLAETRTLSAHVHATAKMCRGMSVAEAAPHLLKIQPMVNRIVDLKEEGVHQITSLLHTITLSLKVQASDHLETQKQRRLVLLYHSYLVHFQTLINESVIELISHEIQGHESLTMQELQSFQRRVFGVLIELFFEQSVRRALEYRPIFPKERPFPPSLLKEIKQKFQGGIATLHAEDLEFISGGNSQIQAFIKEHLLPAHTRWLVSLFITYDLESGVFDSQLALIFKLSQGSAPQPTAQGIISALTSIMKSNTFIAAQKDLDSGEFYRRISVVLESSLDEEELDSENKTLEPKVKSVVFEQRSIAEQCGEVSKLFESLIQFHLGVVYQLTAGIQGYIDVNQLLGKPLSIVDPTLEERTALAEVALRELIAEESERGKGRTRKKPSLHTTTATLTKEEEEEESPPEEPSDLPPPLLPTSPGITSFDLQRTAMLIQRTHLSSVEIAKAHSQLYLHQSLAIASLLIQNPGYLRALSFSFCESLHLSLEQEITARGIEDGKLTIDDVYDHKLETRLKQCGLVKLMPTILRVTSIGTYNARYPHINEYSQGPSSFTGQILRAARTDEPLNEDFLLEIVSNLNAILSGQELPPLTRADLELLNNTDAPLPVTASFDVSTLRQRIDETFAPCHEKTDLLIHLDEFTQIGQMTHHARGIPRPLIGVIQQALFRIVQYSTRNLMILLIRRKFPEISKIPARHAELCRMLNLPKPLEKAIQACDMKKGLAYPIGKEGKRSSARTGILVKSHLLSLTPVGFTLQGSTISEESAQQNLEGSILELHSLLGALLEHV